jgi:hypothetical protein
LACDGQAATVQAELLRRYEHWMVLVGRDEALSGSAPCLLASNSAKSRRLRGCAHGDRRTVISSMVTKIRHHAAVVYV